MNSAKRLKMKMVRKIHSDQKPRRLAAKFDSLRWLIGEMRKPKNRSCVAALGIARLEIDSRVDHVVHQIADDPHDEAEQSEDVERAEHDRVVAVDERLESQQTEPIEREDHLD